jgi:hypothetical protein
MSYKLFTSLIFDGEFGPIRERIAGDTGSDNEIRTVAFRMPRWQEMIPGEVQPVRPDLAVETTVATHVVVSLQNLSRVPTRCTSAFGHLQITPNLVQRDYGAV